jgi:hypothetical protein
LFVRVLLQPGKLWVLALRLDGLHIGPEGLMKTTIVSYILTKGIDTIDLKENKGKLF